ncbi:MAG: hypothetical protein N2Z74_00075, partial [Syntrophales bacterium]|nr:hypothetical protein [Syntrophales bacterium]
MKITTIITVLIVMLLSACAQTMIWHNSHIVNGRILMTQSVTPEEAIEREMKKDGVVSLKDLAAAKTDIKAGADLTNITNAFGLSLTAVVWGLAGFESAVKNISLADAIFSGAPYAKAATGFMAVSTVTDALLSYQQWQQRKNSAYCRLDFGKKMEVEKARNGKKETFLDILLDGEEERKGSVKIDQCRWRLEINPTRNGLLYCTEEEKKSIRRWNYSLTAREVLLMIHYNDQDTERPTGDPCHFREAESLLKAWVGRITGLRPASTRLRHLGRTARCGRERPGGSIAAGP